MSGDEQRDRPDRSPRPDRAHRPDRDDEPVLPERSRDDSDVGWGDERGGGRDAEWYRRERPPHHGD